MDNTKKIVVAMLAVALVLLGVAVAYGYTLSSRVPGNYAANGGYAPYGISGGYGNYGPYGGYGEGERVGPYGYAGPYSNYGGYGYYAPWGGPEGGMMGGYGRGME